MKSSPNDPVIDEVRAVRSQISARFDHNPARLVAYYQTLQEQFADRLLKMERNSAQPDQPADRR
jgi:hypothetical protein